MTTNFIHTNFRVVKPLILILLLVSGSAVFADGGETEESLNEIINSSTSHDTTKASAYLQLSEILFVTNFDTLIPLCKKAQEIAEQGLVKSTNSVVRKSFLRTLSGAYNNEGYAHGTSGYADRALEYYRKALTIQQQIGDYSGIAYSLNNIAFVYQNQGLIAEALKYYHESAKIQEAIEDDGLAITLNNLGLMYKHQGDFDKSLEYYERSLELRKTLNDKRGIANSYNNLGRLYDEEDEINIALMYYKKSLSIRLNIDYKRGIANSYANIADSYFQLDRIEESEEYILKSIQMNTELNYLPKLNENYVLLGRILSNQGSVYGATKVALRAYDIGLELGFPHHISIASELLSDLYEKAGDKGKALDYYRIHIEMRDSTVNNETQEMFARNKAKFEYEKQKAIDDNEHRNQILLKQEANERQRTITYVVIVGLAMVVGFLIFIFNRLQLTKKQKEKISIQKGEIELNQKEILDSITYAKRIQHAILPSHENVSQHLGDSFILYKPKDIVAGDFYWLQTVDDTVLFAAADCTGHGVPGAMVSVVCNNGLNRSVREGGFVDPGLILDSTREIVTDELDTSSEKVRDGMDIALCSIQGGILKYAGANSPLWIIRNGEVIEYKPDKQPVGYFEMQHKFKTHQIELVTGDTIYIFSDGYVDQFGGPRNKKFKARALRELLLKIQPFDMLAQRKTLDQEFENWRGDNEQIDDVCIIGVRI